MVTLAKTVKRFFRENIMAGRLPSLKRQKTARNQNTKSDNLPFSREVVDAVWKKGRPIPDFDPDMFRKDKFGGWMKRSEYGNLDGDFGWEIDHIRPVSENGGDELDNLQPLYWKYNRIKGDAWPEAACLLSPKEQ